MHSLEDLRNIRALEFYLGIVPGASYCDRGMLTTPVSDAPQQSPNIEDIMGTFVFNFKTREVTFEPIYKDKKKN